MCEIIGQAQAYALSRRDFIYGAAGLAGATATTALLGGTASAATPDNVPTGAGLAATTKYQGQGTWLALLGTAGGPVWWEGTNRRGCASAVAVDGHIYLVDCGNGVGDQLQSADLVASGYTGGASKGSRWGLENISGMFLTHLHSDHTTDYNTLMQYAWPHRVDEETQPTQVFGPGRRGAMEPVIRQDEAPPIINSNNPTPGTVDMTNYLYQAFALDFNDRMRSSNRPDPRPLLDVHDIDIPESAGYHPNDNPSPEGMEPFKVYENDRMRVSATLVYHFPIAPAFAYRFDTDDGSIVFSGDTGPNDNLIRMARGADILVHEVIDQAWIDAVFPPGDPNREGLRDHMLTAHTSNLQVGKVAEAAGVKTLVLNHIVPGNAPPGNLMKAQNDFSGQVVVGEDLMQFDIGKRNHAG